jgi:hypothetical protein
MYDIKSVIASFLRKLQQNFAQSQYFPIYTTKGVVMGFHYSPNVLLKDYIGRIWELFLILKDNSLKKDISL